MVKGVSFSVAVAAWMLTGQHAYASNISNGSQLYRAAIRVAVSGLEQLVANATSAIGRFMVDGGGDGDGSSDGSDTGTADSTSNGDGNSGDTNSSDGPSDPADSVTSQANTTVSDPSDPTPIETPEEIAIEAIPTTDPRGGFDPEDLNSAYPTGRDDSASETNEIGGISAGNPVGDPGVKAPVDVGINAVIISGAQSPSCARQRGETE